jgi:hypothetical protein
MTLTINKMRVTIEDRAGAGLRERLHQRLSGASELRCPEHDRPVTAVSIHARENGWFDATWTTCCETLEQQAVAIVKERL